MTRTVTIRSVRTADGEQEQTRMTAPAEWDRLRDTWVLRYEERLGDQTVPTTLKLRGAYAELHRHGAWETALILEPGQAHTCPYRTPFGECPLTVRDALVRHRLTEAGGKIELSYTLDAGGQAAAHRVYITIR